MDCQPIDTNTKPRLRSSSLERPTVNYSEIKSRKQPINNKRKAISSPTSITPVTKKSTTSKMSLTIDDLDRLFEKQTQTLQAHMQQTIKDEMKILSDELKASLDTQIDRINTRIDSIQENVNSQLNDVRADIYDCAEKLKLNEEDSKRISVLNELRLNGIAHSNDENLKDIFLSIAQLIGFDTTNPLHLPSISRSFIKDRRTNEVVQLPRILLKFVAKHIRNQFYGLYLAKVSKQPILHEHINLPQGGRILIMENLTFHNQAIFNEAMKLKREKKLSNVKTIDGIVFVKTNVTENMACIRLLRELDIIVAKSSSQTEHHQTQNSAAFNGPTQNQHNQAALSSMAFSETQQHQHQFHQISNQTTNPSMETV